MTATSVLRQLWEPYRCASTKFSKVTFPGVDRTWELSVASEAVPAFEVFADLMDDYAYPFIEVAGGTYNCRMIAGTSVYSLHAYAVCIDLNPGKNPYGNPLRHNYPAPFITAVEALRTNNAKKVFTWGGRWQIPDAMHWQIDCGPADVKTGIAGQTPAPKPPSTGGITLTITRSVIKEGAKTSLGGDVAICQGLLYAWGHGSTVGTVDGIFGTKTTAAVKAFQKAKALTADGIVGEKTWTALES